MGTVTVSVADAGRNLSKLISTAEAGDDVIITRRGEPAAQLTAARSAAGASSNGRRASVVLAERLALRKHWPTLAQVEATIAQARDGWGE
ncbi:MAG: type II toxin-antitoxin system prevent-host-death family antitoxin [Propionibacteriaceae bacterium]|jgi:prevent-host-death family protein|nr:type II toxin-antitoxin system prevent-host-death family antitoxin [Propionibacteriaceae bacterium]